MNVLITGVSGCVGSRLAPRLRRDGHAVRGFSRRSEEANAGTPTVTGDAVSGEGLAEALDGIDVAYFLIHSMESSLEGSFPARDRRAAENFARAAQTAGTGRIIYLGGLAPTAGAASVHLRSRLEVERILLAATPCSVAFRASIVIGADSRSFRFLVRLVERLPVLAIPAWRDNRTAPIDERDIVELLARAATSDAVCGQALDAGGPEDVTYGELIERIRDHLLLYRPALRLRRLTLTPIASRISAVIADEDHALIGPLMAGLDEDLMPRDDRAARVLEVRLHSLDAAIERALRELEEHEPLAVR
ncbi:MAG: NAD(P)H-binding protein [Solirubrobacterales bacterium]|nr:NAD(P)H-binding protein [Solirubrobacterales bacterium]MBV9535452.1 NAD(P)H-binding protein [Solirubrobacterales bacterium]